MSKPLVGRRPSLRNWRRRCKKALHVVNKLDYPHVMESNGDFCRKLGPCPQRVKVLKPLKGDPSKRYVMCILNGLCSLQTPEPQQVLVRSSKDYARFIGGPLDE